MPTTANDFPYTVATEIAFRDIDAMGHVNNAVYLTYLETARIKFLHQIKAITRLGELPLILAEATVTYKSPAHFGEILAIGLGIPRFGSKSFEFIYQIDGGDGRLVALARTVLVAYDYAAAATVPVPEDFKARVLAFQAGWDPALR